MSNITDDVFGKIITEPEQNAKTVNDTTDEVFGKIGDSNIVYAPVDLTGQYGRGDSQFDSFSEPVALLDNLQQIRSERQPFLHQAFNATIGGLGSGLLTAGESLSLLLDIPNNISAASDYFSKEEEVNTIEANAFSNFFKDTKESLLNDYMPIYRKRPDKVIDFSDSAFYWESFRGIVDSGVGFGLSGMGVGAAVKLTGKALRLARMGNYTSKMSQALNATGKGLQQGRVGQITTGYLTNHAENKIMALELYENSQEELYNQFVEQYETDHNEAPPEELLKKFRLDAKINAGKQANSFLLKGKAFAFIDILQLNRMFKPQSTLSRNLAKESGVKNFLKDQFKPSSMAKEASEEIGQNVLQMELENDARNNMKASGYKLPDADVDNMTFSERLFTFATSEQALLEGAMGALGGPIQYSVTQLPFENFKSSRERFTSQGQQFKRNEEFLKNTLFKEYVKEKLQADASKTFEDKGNEEKLTKSFEQSLQEVTFKRMALQNFEMGTTAQFEEELTALENREDITPEESKEIGRYKEILTELEQDYNTNNRKFAAGTEITNLNSQRKFLEKNLDLFKESRTNLVSELDGIVRQYNEASDTNYTTNNVLNDLQDTSGLFQSFLQSYPTLIQNIKDTDLEVKRLNKRAVGLMTDAAHLKEDNDVMEAFKDVDRNKTLPTDEKIKSLQDIYKLARFNGSKDFIQKRINQYQKELTNVKNNDSVEKNGGSESLRTKAKNSAKPKKKDAVQSLFGEEAQALTSLEESDIDDNVLANEPNVDEGALERAIGSLHSNKIQELYLEATLNNEDSREKILSYVESLDDITPEAKVDVDKILDNLDLSDVDNQVTLQTEGNFDQNILVDIVDEFQEPNNIPEDVTTELESIPLTSKKESDQITSPDIEASNNLIKTTKTQSDLDGVKVVFTDGSEGYKKYLNDNRNKQGDTVEFLLDEKYLNKLNEVKSLYQQAKNNPNAKLDTSLVDRLPIIVKFNNDDNITTRLYPVNKPKPGQKGEAYKTERALREQIITNLINKEKAIGKVQYQYSGAFQTDNKFKSIYSIQGMNKPEAITFLHTDGEGLLRYGDKMIYPETNQIKLKEQGITYKGQIFALVDSTNGKVPLKLNAAKLSSNEIKALQQAFLYITDPVNKAKDNILNTKITDQSLENIYKLVNPADRDYLGDATLGELISHLVHEGPFTSPNFNDKANPVTQLYVNKNNNLIFGLTTDGKNNIVTHEQLKTVEIGSNLTNFLKKYKTRNIDVTNLESDLDYRRLILDNQFLNTDVAVDVNGNPFQSINTSNPVERFKTKAIYVSDNLDNLVPTETESETQDINITNENAATSENLINLAENIIESKVKKEVDTMSKVNNKKITISVEDALANESFNDNKVKSEQEGSKDIKQKKC